ncbi:MAG: hypothetical protein GSR72_08105 [Desulfurococcales archaeon]|nr:hypothetical protein [Desulfurococcales archaeon]
MSVRLFIVLPDVSEAKSEALAKLGANGSRPDVLISYTIVKWKPISLERLRALRRRKVLGYVMLDSGAYHLMKIGEEVDVEAYTRVIEENRDLWDFVVAPDVPGDPRATLERTLWFMESYSGEFLPVLQGNSPRDYVLFLEELASYGVTDRAYTVDGKPVIGVGGLDGYKKRVSFVAEVVRMLARYNVLLHIFGVGIRVLKGLRRRGLLKNVFSVDSSGWLAEIQWRRRTIYGAVTPVEANMHAIRGYLGRAEGLVSV